jgi:pimeloyl-ACP methyl ester carboxylesterase
MPVLSVGSWNIDYAEEGTGSQVIFIHSSVSGNQQWRSLMEALKDRYRVLAINLFGYGYTTPWPENTMQILKDHADLVLALCGNSGEQMHLVGHSFGGSVVLKAALRLDQKVSSLVLIEPNPFYLMAQHKRRKAYNEAKALRDHVKKYGAVGDWRKVAKRFADYWVGEGTWDSMPEKRRSAFVEAMPPNFYEWDTVMNETTAIDTWSALTEKTLGGICGQYETTDSGNC